MVKLAHDGSLRQEVSPLAISVAHLEGLDCYDDLPTSGKLEATTADLPELSCQSPGKTARETAKGKRQKEGGERGIMEEWRRVGEKRGEGTVNWLEPRSQGRVVGGVGRGNCKRSHGSRPVSKKMVATGGSIQ